MLSERQYWLGFSLVKGIGPARVRLLLDHFGSLREAWHADLDKVKQAGIDRRTLNSFKEARQKIDLAAEMARLDRLGIALLTWEDDEYPRLLAELEGIAHAPPVLFMRGTLLPEDEWAVAIVGTRSISPYGRQVTHQLANELAANGLTIVSGLARGVDAEAHRAALDAGGRTIAIMPSGLNEIYPPEHRKLAAEIMRQGAIISSFPVGTKPDGQKFPVRNRTMSGLARGVIVTEAGDKSGALITARHALEQGREVFAVPGNITKRTSSGVNRLIQDGAHPVMEAADVLDVLNLERITQYVNARESLPDVSEEEQKILDHLTADPQHIDEIARICDLPVSQISTALTMLQLKGLVREVGPVTYVRI